MATATVVGFWLLPVTEARAAQTTSDASSPCLPGSLEKLKAHDFIGVVADCTDAIQRHPYSADAYALRGRARYFLRQLADAQSDLDYAIALSPRYTFAVMARCMVFKELAEYDAALADCVRALKIDPDYYETYFARAGVYLKEGDLRKAIDDYTTYLGRYPNDPDSHYNRGLSFAGIGDCKAAIQDFNAQLQLQAGEAKSKRVCRIRMT